MQHNDSVVLPASLFFLQSPSGRCALTCMTIVTEVGEYFMDFGKAYALRKHDGSVVLAPNWKNANSMYMKQFLGVSRPVARKLVNNGTFTVAELNESTPRQYPSPSEVTDFVTDFGKLYRSGLNEYQLDRLKNP